MTQIQILRIVVTSSGDAQTECDLLPSVIEELNRGMAGLRGWRLELLPWQMDSEMPECDLLIGIFWKSLGASAPNGGQTWPLEGLPPLLVYFNQQPATPRSIAEIDEWGEVIKFRDRLPAEGVWWPYQGKVQFEKLVRGHLTNFIRTLPKSGSEEAQPKAPPETVSNPGPAVCRTAEELLNIYLARLAENIGQVRLLGEADSRPLTQVFVQLRL
ncbi:MAG TPA: hypothetical protein VJ302_09895, partial [Blastocatellia bacterium]|nr:hypothetical protein [Blastocatellia bacterium]